MCNSRRALLHLLATARVLQVYAPEEKVETRNYGVARYGMEVQRLCDVLDKHLADRRYLCGDEYTIAGAN